MRHPLAPLLLWMICASPVAAQESYPVRPITMVVPISPGTSADLIARSLGAKLGERLRQPVVIENKAGASGMIGLDFTAKAAPNGYTVSLMVNSSTFLPSLVKTMPFDLVNDFAPIAKVATAPLTLAVHPTVPARDLKDLIALLKANPGKYTYATPGNGTVQHVGMELFKLEFGLDVLHIPHKAIADATNNLVGGHVHMTFGSAPTLVILSGSGKLRLLAMTESMPGTAAASVPTFADLGYPSFGALTGWYGFIAPAKTPAVIIARLNQELRQIIEMPDIRSLLIGKQGLGLAVGSPEEMSALIRANIERWGRVVREAKISVE
ncbi:MAG: tripartite tricarboxylate transporter substrate binding protein [Betaproteobacteria bacterium]|nr:tripartite tricarboxylate transporter substrate binding protein [Betaproteobacteria bacterium]